MLNRKAVIRLAVLDLNRLWWPQSCMSEKLLLKNRMIKAKNIGVRISDSSVSFVVRLAMAMQHKARGIIVLMICHVAILSSLSM